MLNPKPITTRRTTDTARTPTAAQLSYALDQARGAVQDSRAPRWLGAYYRATGGYAGNRVLTVEPNDPLRITCRNLYAIPLLNA